MTEPLNDAEIDALTICPDCSGGGELPSTVTNLRDRIRELEQERDTARATIDALDRQVHADGREIAQLRAELAKPVAPPWHDMRRAAAGVVATRIEDTCDPGPCRCMWIVRSPVFPYNVVSSGFSATAQGAMHAADIAASVSGWRVVN